MQQEVVQQIVQSVAPELWYLLIQSMATVAIGMVIYKTIQALVAYLFLRFDKELGKNVGVVVDGKKGYIVHISIRHLIIKFDENNGDIHSGNELLIPITQVGSRAWEIIRRKD